MKTLLPFLNLDHFMDLLLMLLVLISLTLATTKSSQSNSSESAFNCGHVSLELRYPFTSNAHHRSHAHDSPEFHLLCRDNLPVVRFPSYGELGIRSISYSLKKVDLVDPRNCVHEVFLNLDLSHTHLSYYYVVKNYTYLNCSSRLPSPSFERIPCLSGINHHVYTVDNTTAVPDCSCRILKTVAIPFSYSPYLSDNHFGLGLTWDLPQAEANELDKTARPSHYVSRILGSGDGCNHDRRLSGLDFKETKDENRRRRH
uniref:RING-type E3 ubiquitin transferase n=1 Tax=Kalanchoe fedtschenkoi TaxID=63787 RepID=A0A7N0USR1_KALFE